jgi:alkylation response protein AidB-like acyl-CoA dehydrogenase
MNPPDAAGKARPQGPDERESRAVAEAARESEWTRPSFLRELFLGRFDLHLIHPHPRPDPAEQERARPFLAALERFLAERVDAEEIERTGRVPDSVVRGLRELGAFGIKIAREYGGLGLSQYTYGKAMALLNSSSAALVTWLSAHQSIGVPVPVKMFGTEEQKKKYLPRCARGEISAFALTENDVGSDPARMSATAVPTEDGAAYILNGEKLWCTNGPVADHMVVMARVPSAEKKSGKISAFIVEASMPGVMVTHRLEFMGLRGIENAIIRFDDVRVPRENLLWGEGQGLKLALSTLNVGRVSIPAGCAAAGKWCLQVVRHWANERVQWGKPVGHHEAVAQMIAEIASRTFAMEAVSDLAALLVDQGRSDIRLEAGAAKLYNSDAAWQVADLALQVRGGRGYETAASLASRGEAPIPVERLLRDLRINRIFEGSNEILRLFLAREAVDVHLKVAGALLKPELPLSRKAAAYARMGAFYSTWYPRRWFGWGRWPRYAEFGPLAPHLRYIERASRRLAREQFHAMARYQAALERKQGVLFRFVDVGVELFAMAAACVRAQMMVGDDPSDRSPYTLADLYCRGARRRIAQSFRAVWSNDDDFTYRVAREALEGRFRWLEEGVLPPPGPPASGGMAAAGAAPGAAPSAPSAPRPAPDQPVAR